MKKLLIALAGIAAALGCFAPGAKAMEMPRTGITTNFTPVQISITVITNGVEKDVNDVETGAVGKAKIDNSILLKIFAHWAGSNAWPAGTKLVIGWDAPWEGSVLVVDKSGTNVLFNSAYEYPISFFDEASNYFYVDFDGKFEQSGDGPDSYKYIDKSSGSDSVTMHDYGYFELYDDEVYLPYTDIVGNGNTKISYTQNWKPNGTNTTYTTWSQTTDLKSGEDASSDIYWLDREYGQVSGKVTSSGSGKGEDYWYDP